LTTTQTKTDDLSRIKDNLASKIAEHQADIDTLQSSLQQARMDVESFSRNRANVASDLAHVQSEVTRLSAVVAQAKQDAEAVVGTSLATEKLTLLKGFKAELGKAQTELANLTSSLTKDDEDIAQAGLIVQALVQKLNELQTAKAELVSTHQRFDQQHCEDVKAIGLEVLAEIDSEISSLQAKIDQASAHRAEQVKHLAQELSTWPELCEKTIAEVIGEQEDPPTVRVAQAQLADAQAALSRFKREQVQSVADLGPTMMGYEQQVRSLTAHIEMLRQQHRRSVATQLLRELGVLSTPPTVAAPLVVIERN